jgi:hypothetical protein
MIPASDFDINEKSASADRVENVRSVDFASSKAAIFLTFLKFSLDPLV